MSHTIRIAAGRVALDGTVELRSGDGYRQVQPTRAPIVATLTPLGRDVQALCEAWQRGEVELCPVCNRLDCDCQEWGEIMHTSPFDPDPHGDLSVLQSMDIPL
jgi:hypothetical protein